MNQSLLTSKQKHVLETFKFKYAILSEACFMISKQVKKKFTRCLIISFTCIHTIQIVRVLKQIFLSKLLSFCYIKVELKVQLQALYLLAV